ncbi:helix-turn-helix domain-containing protein [Halovivax limisalsi]|uniref:helix-turn-helix domain-containing protein n=1 Tax=Halovivax limisalsi TaxID=1453760 RepID=UPI001FFCBDE5|nr:helix-turn-helix domain-containing protein [Halovivax limisalsi]
MTGYQATIVVDDPGGCPVALAADARDSTVESVSRSSLRDAETVVEEFTVDDPNEELAGQFSRGPAETASAAPAADTSENHQLADSTDGTAEDPVTLTPVGSAGATRTYRFTRSWSDDCVCEVVEGAGNPVNSLRAVDGALHVGVTGPDLDSLSETITDLKARFDGVSLRELTRHAESDESDLVLVDRARLTARQQEVLETAHELGYFEYPKGANAGEVADALGISGSTFAEHLGAAQSKLLDAILEAR